MNKSAVFSVLVYGLPALSLLSLPSYAVRHDAATMGAPPPGEIEAISGSGVPFPEAVPTTTKTTTSVKSAKRSTFPILKPVSKADLEWGTEQLEQLLEDRPQMQAYVEEGDAIWTKAVRGFAGETTGMRVTWNNEGLKDKAQGFIADHIIPSEKDPNCYIRLAELDENYKPVDGERLWSGLMYEFNNLANWKAFDAINNFAVEGGFTKNQWLNQVCYAEWRAFKPTLEFYHGTFAPLMFKRNIKSRPVSWRIVEWRDSYPAWIGQFRNPHSYPYNYWGNWWDTQIFPYLKRSGKWDAAQAARAQRAALAAQQAANPQAAQKGKGTQKGTAKPGGAASRRVH